MDKIKTFMKYVRSPDQSVKDYIAGFDAKYNAAIKSGLAALAQPYLMWLVVENGQVSDLEHKVIMGGIDLSKEDTLYTQAKASMLKYLEGPGHGGGESGPLVAADRGPCMPAAQIAGHRIGHVEAACHSLGR